MEAMLDATELASKVDEAASAAAASEPEFVLWQGRLGHPCFRRGRGGVFTIFDAVSQGGTGATFYVDARLGGDLRCSQVNYSWVGSGVYDQETLRFAVEHKLPVTFWGLVELRAQP